MEIWKPVKGFEEYYLISSKGNIKNALTGKHLSLQRINKGRGSLLGYVRVSLKGKNKYLHKIVAETFLPNPEGKKYVDHLDGNSLNNCIENLKWVSASENNSNPVTQARMKKFLEKKKKETLERKRLIKELKALEPKKPRKASHAKYWYKGQTLSSYCSQKGLNIYTVRDRIRKLGMSVEEAVSKPLMTQSQKGLKTAGKFNW